MLILNLDEDRFCDGLRNVLVHMVLSGMTKMNTTNSTTNNKDDDKTTHNLNNVNQ